MFDLLSTSITNLLKKQLPYIIEEKEEIVKYGINILIYQISVFTFIFFLAFVLDIVVDVLITYIIYGILRICAGGAHCCTRIECFVISNTILFGTVYLGKTISLNSYLPSVLLYAINIIFVYLYAPGDTLEKPILSNMVKTLQKVLSYIVITIVFIVSLTLYNKYNSIYTMIIIINIPFLLQLSPIGYKLSRCKHSCEA